MRPCIFGGSLSPMSTWYDYVQRIAGSASQTQIERETGIRQSNLSRWKNGGTPAPEHAARIANSYGRPVLEAFVAAGFLTAEQANAQVVVDPSLSHFSDETLVNEIGRRLAFMQERVDWYQSLYELEVDRSALSDREFTDAEIIAIARDARERSARREEERLTEEELSIVMRRRQALAEEIEDRAARQKARRTEAEKSPGAVAGDEDPDLTTARDELQARKVRYAQFEEQIQEELEDRAARQVGRKGRVQQAREEQDSAGEPEPLRDDDFDPR